MATAPNKVTVILVRGLLGMIYSRGMDTLAAKLRAKGYNVQVWNHSWLFIAWFANTAAIAAEVARLIKAGYVVVLVGHSFGANTILFVLYRLLQLMPIATIPLVIAVDPAAQYDTTVAKNAVKAMGFRQAGNLIGRGQLGPKGDKRIEDILTQDAHVYIDDDPAVHNRALAEIAKV